MNNTTVFLIRHGEVEYPLNDKGQKLLYGPDVDLSEEGRKGVEALGQELLRGGVSMDVIYTSPYTRALQTSDILSDILGVKSIIDVEEIKDTFYPEFENMLYEDLIALGGNTYSHPISKHQESLEDIGERMSHAFLKIFRRAEKEGKTVGIVGHGDPLRVLFEHLINPENPLPDPATMRDENYLGKGTAVMVVLDSSMRVIEQEFIIPNKEGRSGVEQKF